MKNLLPIFCCCLLFACQEDKTDVPIQQQADVGLFKNQSIESNAFRYDKVTQTYTLAADEADDYRLLWTALEGDFVLDVKLPRVKETGTYGLLFYTDVATKNPIARLEVANNQLSFVPAAEVNRSNVLSVEVEYLRLMREGTQLMAYYSLPDQPFTLLAMQSLMPGETLYGGLFAKATTQKLSFQNLNLTYLSDEDRGIVSKVEILDLETGIRRVILEQEGILEAPNWYSNGQTITLRKEGRLYQFGVDNADNWLELPRDSSWQAVEAHLFLEDSSIYIASVVDSVGTRLYLSGRDSASNDLVLEKSPALLEDLMQESGEILYRTRRSDRGSWQLYRYDGNSEKNIRLSKSVLSADYSAADEQIYYCSKRAKRPKVWSMTSLGLQKKQLNFDEWSDWKVYANGDNIWVLSTENKDTFKSENQIQWSYLRRLSLSEEKQSFDFELPFYAGKYSLGINPFSLDGKQMVFISYSAVPPSNTIEANQVTEL
ncbi:MAG: hypothetical protein AAGI23_18475 [Bacteroidota bacterium]